MLLSRRRMTFFLTLLTPGLLFYVLNNHAATAQAYFDLTSSYLSPRPNTHSPGPPLSSTDDIFDHPFTSSDAIRSVCAATDWNPKLFFTCDGAHGGVASIRNSMLSCVRYAIHAGAGMTLPRFDERDAADIARVIGSEKKSELEMAGMEVLFDAHHFVKSLALSCPQLKLYNTTADMPSHPTITRISLQPENIGGPLTPKGRKLQSPGKWKSYFTKWLSEHTDPITTLIVRLERSYMQYPIYSDSKRFTLDFGQILKFKRELRVVATTVLKNIIEQHNMDVDPWAPVWLSSFFGAHLRTERDAQHAWPAEQFEFSKYSAQSQRYIIEAGKLGASLVYIASGDKQEIISFSADARDANMTVISKHDLLHGKDLRALEAMTFDEQAMVDFLVLLKSQNFVGVAHSAFAWNVALWRHMFAMKKKHLKAGLLKDELSEIVGDVDEDLDFAACLWP